MTSCKCTQLLSAKHQKKEGHTHGAALGHRMSIPIRITSLGSTDNVWGKNAELMRLDLQNKQLLEGLCAKLGAVNLEKIRKGSLQQVAR